jgi:starvation-inducible DNA-binding protein
MLADEMKVLLGSTFTYYWKAHSFHMNVEGADFYQYHKMLQDVYEASYETIDTIGEYIRTLDSYSPQSIQRLCQLSVIQEQPKIPRAELMIAELQADTETMVELINRVFECASSEKQENIANYMAELLDIYKKYNWFFKSILKKQRA